MNPKKIAYLSLVILGQILVPSWNNLWAQVESIRAGEPMQLRLYDNKSIIGRFRNIQNDTLFIDDKWMLAGIPFSNIKELKVARGGKTHLFKGSAIGGAIGGILGIFICYSQLQSSRSDNTGALGELLVKPIEEGLQSVGAIFCFGSFAAYGTLAGALIGYMVPAPSWVMVTLPDISSKNSAAAGDSRGIARQSTAKITPSLITQKHRWRCIINSGITSSEMNNDIESAIIQSGFNKSDTLEEAGLKISIYYPTDKTDPLKIGMPLSLQVDYLLKPYLSSSLLMLHSTLATVSGHQSNPEIFLKLKARSMALCPLLILRLQNGKSELGIGPGLFCNQIDLRQIGEVSSRRQKITPGMVAHIAVRYPERTRLFISIGLQYRWRPKTTFGPFKMWSGQTSSVLDRFTADFTHLFSSVGLGYHF